MHLHSLEGYLLAVPATIITEWFIYLIGLIFVLAVIFSLLNWFSRFTQYAATLMTSLGILGTFIGIVIGLLGFDTSNIDGSIPALLEGLKTAFITSICGLIGAIVFNFLDTLFFQNIGRKNANNVESQVTPDDIHLIMESQNSLLENISLSLTTLNNGIMGNEEGSLVGQFKMLRADIYPLHQQLPVLTDLLSTFKLFISDTSQRHEKFEKNLFVALNDFAEMLSKSATEQIIEALKNVIEDFNKNLTEQFGENFKALDESVKKLVLWQEQYKEHIELIGKQYEQSVNSLLTTQDAVSGISQECENIPATMENLKLILESNQYQIEELQRHLAVFVEMRDAAVSAVPTIQEQIDNIGTQLSNASENIEEKMFTVSERLLDGSAQMQVALEEGASHFRDSVTTTQQSFNELANTVKNSSEDLSETLKDTSEELSQYSRATVSEMKDATTSMQNEIVESVSIIQGRTEAIGHEMTQVLNEFKQNCESLVQESLLKSSELTRNLNEHLERSRNSHEQYLQSSVEKTGQIINSELESLEKATAREIQRAIQEMGDSLVKITGRFVQDYEHMVNAMDRVITNHTR